MTLNLLWLLYVCFGNRIKSAYTLCALEKNICQIKSVRLGSNFEHVIVSRVSHFEKFCNFHVQVFNNSSFLFHFVKVLALKYFIKV